MYKINKPEFKELGRYFACNGEPIVCVDTGKRFGFFDAPVDLVDCLRNEHTPLWVYSSAPVECSGLPWVNVMDTTPTEQEVLETLSYGKAVKRVWLAVLDDCIGFTRDSKEATKWSEDHIVVSISTDYMFESDEFPCGNEGLVAFIYAGLTRNFCLCDIFHGDGWDCTPMEYLCLDKGKLDEIDEYQAIVVPDYCTSGDHMPLWGPEEGMQAKSIEAWYDYTCRRAIRSGDGASRVSVDRSEYDKCAELYGCFF